MLTVTQRPDANLYENNHPEYGEDPYYYSRWSAAHLPLVYKISNTKFPINSTDSSDAYTSVINRNGYARFDLSGTYETYIVGEKVTVTGTVYSGVYEVKEVVAGEYITLNIAFSATDTGTIQRYYDNYNVLIKLYAGIATNHPLYATNPIAYIGTFAIAPNSSNISIIDVADLVKQDISQDNDIDGTGRPNDLNAWTSFYIEYAETYDLYDATIPYTYTSDYTTDLLEGCTQVVINNGSFTSDLSDWSQANSLIGGSLSLAFVYDSGSAKITPSFTDIGNWSKYLYQSVNFQGQKAYEIVIDWEMFISVYTMAFGSFSVYATNSLSGDITSELIYQKSNIIASVTETKTLRFTLNDDKQYLVFYFEFPLATSSLYAKINSVVVNDEVSEDCKAYIYASNSTRQFFDTLTRQRTVYGGNMAEYVMNYNTQEILGKFLTRFTTPVLFSGNYFDISCILPQSTIDTPYTNDGLLYRIKQYDSSDTLISTTDTEIENDGDGVYRLRLDDKITQDNATIQLIRTNTNQDWFTAYGVDTAKYYVGSYNSFTEYSLTATYKAQKVFVTDFEKAVILGYNNGTGRIVIFTYDNGVSTDFLGGNVLFAGTLLFALDNQNWAVCNNGTSGDILVCENNALSLEAMGFSPYVQGVVISSNGTIYIITQSPFATTYIYKRVSSGNWVQEYVFASNVLYITSSDSIKIEIYDDVLYVPYHFMGQIQVLKYPLSTGQPTSIDVTSGSNENSISVYDENNILVFTDVDLFVYDGVSFTQDTGINTIMASNSDATNIKSISFESEDVIRVGSGERIYTRLLGTWTTDAGGAYSAPATFTSINGKELTETEVLQVSEVKPIRVDDICSKQDIYLSWINVLGNWEYWKFTARKTYTKNIESEISVRRNIFASFPDNFTSETQDDRIAVEAYDSVTVRSQYMTKAELDVVAEIIQSIRVQEWISTTEKITVKIDQKKVTKYSDGDKLFAIEFDIIYPQIQIQRQ